MESLLFKKHYYVSDKLFKYRVPAKERVRHRLSNVLWKKFESWRRVDRLRTG
jgi:hypothetical protein